MKKFSLLALAAAGLLLGACSSDKEAVDVAGEVQEYAANGEGFIGLTIQIPSSTNTTRANDDFNNGEGDEFLINNAKLYLFKGTSEADATFIQASTLTDSWQADDKGANESSAATTKVTSTSVSYAKIDKLTLTSSQKLYGYVVLNNNGGISDPTTNQLFTAWVGTAISEAQRGGTLLGAISDKGLLMTNSPVSQTPGGLKASTGAILQAIELNPNKIKSTPTAAIADPSGCIYVERAAAKVTLYQTAFPSTFTSGSITVNMEVLGWQVINTEPTFYVGRKFDTSWFNLISDFHPAATVNTTGYRFVTLNKFAPTIPSTTGHLDAYRTYFGIDPQYNTDANLQTTVATAYDPATGASNPTWLAPGKYSGTSPNLTPIRAFVTENTFDVEHQTWMNTTQVAVVVKFNDGADIYTLTNDPDIYTASTVNTAIASRINAAYAVHTAAETVAGQIAQYYKDKDATVTDGTKMVVTVSVVADATTGASTAGNQTPTLSYSVSATYDGNNYTPATGLDDFQTALSKATGYASLTSAAETAAGQFDVSLYKNGLSYYNIRIRHFGENETPWDAITSAQADAATPKVKQQPGGTIVNIYGKGDTDEEKLIRDKRFLGRYGVVRDTWYDIELTGVNRLGSPTPIDANGTGKNTPDDELEEEYYIAAHVHILPWSLRTQSVILK